MKIYARQIPPEYQESPLTLGSDFWPEDIAIYGNRHLCGHGFDLFDRLPGILDELCDAWEDITSGAAAYYKSWIDALADIARPDGRPEYTREERKNAWPELLDRYCNTYDDPAVYAAALALITGRAWDSCTLRGCCQGDWQHCIYPVENWDGDALERLEAEYFNTGTEWIVHDEETPPARPEDINGFSVYCPAWNEDGIRQEIADAAGGASKDVILYKFDRYIQVTEYVEV